METKQPPLASTQIAQSPACPAIPSHYLCVTHRPWVQPQTCWLCASTGWVRTWQARTVRISTLDHDQHTDRPCPTMQRATPEQLGFDFLAHGFVAPRALTARANVTSPAWCSDNAHHVFPEQITAEIFHIQPHPLYQPIDNRNLAQRLSSPPQLVHIAPCALGEQVHIADLSLQLAGILPSQVPISTSFNVATSTDGAPPSPILTLNADVVVHRTDFLALQRRSMWLLPLLNLIAPKYYAVISRHTFAAYACSRGLAHMLNPHAQAHGAAWTLKIPSSEPEQDALYDAIWERYFGDLGLNLHPALMRALSQAQREGMSWDIAAITDWEREQAARAPSRFSSPDSIAHHLTDKTPVLHADRYCLPFMFVSDALPSESVAL